jgi:hypothetical protein
MRRDPDRLNQTILIALAVAAITVSLWGVGRTDGWFDARDPDQPLLVPTVAAYVARNARWFWPLSALIAVLLCVLSLLWLRAQLRLPRRASTDLIIQVPDGEVPDGLVRVHGEALAEALEHDVAASVEVVRRASARVTGDHHDLDIDLRIEVEENADLADVRHHVETDVLPRFARAACVQHTTTYLDLRLQPPARHVR